ncbi:hypothetical protein LTR56_003747 [Elasticomyces elasticus]|nr:hypothetical protein LTR22_014615 [Elasticomyces elasticus]KAK3654889.1 hypothetical protein LTR56_003747 [Elasticomyces elasticus]KAK4928782.1 hypothetical protein LTR49_004591 [Elasticomyces elasticus]KAK5766592.1 hypothetical protein LTS12_003211 [Elasticomyces elasticus]
MALILWMESAAQSIAQMSEAQRTQNNTVHFVVEFMKRSDEIVSRAEIRAFIRNIAAISGSRPLEDEQFREILQYYDTDFASRTTKQMRQGMMYGPVGWHSSGCAGAAHRLAVATGAIKPFPFMELPPELRNRIYEKCIDGDQYLIIPGDCHHGPDQRDPPLQPAITRVSRNIRIESLAMFYSVNKFEFHALRFDFSRLIAHLDWVSTWAVKAIKQVRIFMNEVAWHGDKFMVNCAEGIWSLFKWLALTDFDVKLACSDKGSFEPVHRALITAKRWRDDRQDGREENSLRIFFDQWLQEEDLSCTCKASAWCEDNLWYACSRYTPTYYLLQDSECRAEDE